MTLSPLDIGILLLTSAAALQVIWHAVTAINEMTKGTRLAIRLAYITMAVASASVLLCPAFFRVVPQHSEAALIVSIALLTLFDRRNPTTS